MKNQTKLLSTLIMGLFLTTVFTQCGDAKKTADNVGDKTQQVADNAAKTVTDAANKTGEMVDDAAKTAEDMAKMDSKDGSLSFEQGSWAYNVLHGINSGNTTVFTLDQIPFEGEELSDAGAAQLDNLADILKANPGWNIEIQGHTASPAKKLANGIGRAKWVQLKMNTRGITGKQISAKGYGDDKLIAGIDPTDEKNRRITIALNKSGDK